MSVRYIAYGNYPSVWFKIHQSKRKYLKFQDKDVDDLAWEVIRRRFVNYDDIFNRYIGLLIEIDHIKIYILKYLIHSPANRQFVIYSPRTTNIDHLKLILQEELLKIS